MKNLTQFIKESMINESTRGTLIVIDENGEYIYYVINHDAFYEDGYGEEFEKITKKYKFNSTRILAYLDADVDDERGGLYRLVNDSDWKDNDWNVMSDFAYIIDCSTKQFLTFNYHDDDEGKQFTEIAMNKKMIQPKATFTMSLFSYLNDDERVSYWERIFDELNLNNLKYDLKQDNDYVNIKFNISNDNEFITLAAFFDSMLQDEEDGVENFIEKGGLYWKMMHNKYKKEITAAKRKINKNGALWDIVSEDS